MKKWLESSSVSGLETKHMFNLINRLKWRHEKAITLMEEVQFKRKTRYEKNAIK